MSIPFGSAYYSMILSYLIFNIFFSLIIIIIIIVRTRFVTNHNSIGLARKKAQTISFVERGFERLGLSHWAVSLLVVFIHG